jgi:hypothetical protein
VRGADLKIAIGSHIDRLGTDESLHIDEPLSSDSHAICV